MKTVKEYGKKCQNFNGIINILKKQQRNESNGAANLVQSNIIFSGKLSYNTPLIELSKMFTSKIFLLAENLKKNTNFNENTRLFVLFHSLFAIYDTNISKLRIIV